jgi:hypothetical protein
MSVKPSDYADTALADIEAARQQYNEDVRLGRNPTVPDYQGYIDDMYRAAETENTCTKWTEGPLHEADKVSNFCFKFSYCKASITVLKFILTMSAIIQIANDTSYFNQSSTSSYSSSTGSYYYWYVTNTTRSLTNTTTTTLTNKLTTALYLNGKIFDTTVMPFCYPAGLVIVGLNFARLTYIIFVSFVAIKGCNTGMKLFCNLAFKGCLEVSFFDCCCGLWSSENGWWKLLQDNLIYYMVYYGLCTVLSFSFGICIYATVYLYSSSGLILYFMVFLLTLLNFILEIVRYVIYKKRWG